MVSYAVVALFRPLDVGTQISRRAWPAHVTLASNFVTLAPVERVVDRVEDADVFADPLTVRFGELALFGPNRDVPVRLVSSAPVIAAHGRLADRLEPLPGFAPEEPAYWRDGYHPHVTLGASIVTAEGDHETVSHVAVVEILVSTARVTTLIRDYGAPGISGRCATI